MTTHETPLICERRLIVEGWTYNEAITFKSCHMNADEKFLASERARIGEEVEIWQPHITKVTLEERYVTPWKASGL